MTSEHPEPTSDASSHSETRLNEEKPTKPESKEQHGRVARAVEFFDSTTKVLVAVGALIAAAAALWAGIAHLSSSGTPNSSAGATAQLARQTAAIHVDQCEAQHQLTQQSQELDITVSTTAFDSCAWPAPSYADADGFTRVTVQDVAGPGVDEASDTDYADRITGPCGTFTLAYDFGVQGAAQHLAPFTAPAGMLTSVDQPGTAWPGGVKSLGFYPARNEVDVLHNSNYLLISAACRT
jgi:hypothetical protein